MKLGGSLVDGGGAVSEPQNFVGILVSYTISLLFSAVGGVVDIPHICHELLCAIGRQGPPSGALTAPM